MFRIVRFVRERNPYILVVWFIYILFFKNGFRYSKLILCRSYTSILSWFRSLSFLFASRDVCGDVRVLLVDDTRIRVGSSEKVLYVAFEPYLRKIVYMMVSDVATY